MTLSNSASTPFTGAVTGIPGAKNAYNIGNPYAAFLLGIPDKTFLDTNTFDAIDGYDPAYAFYGQDDWKVTPRLTVNFGLRYELHPRFYDHDANISNFLPDYQSIVNGKSVLGAVVIPDDGLSILSPRIRAVDRSHPDPARIQSRTQQQSPYNEQT